MKQLFLAFLTFFVTAKVSATCLNGRDVFPYLAYQFHPESVSFFVNGEDSKKTALNLIVRDSHGYIQKTYYYLGLCGYFFSSPSQEERAQANADLLSKIKDGEPREIEKYSSTDWLYNGNINLAYLDAEFKQEILKVSDTESVTIITRDQKQIARVLAQCLRVQQAAIKNQKDITFFPGGFSFGYSTCVVSDKE